MDEQEKKKLIEYKECEIKKLRDELKELKESEGISTFVTEEVLDWGYYNNLCYKSHASHIKPWESIRKLTTEIHRHNHIGENLTVKTLTREEKMLSAKMADEVIRIYNRYIKELYPEECEGIDE